MNLLWPPLAEEILLAKRVFFEPNENREKRDVYVRTSSPCQLAGISYNRLNSLLDNELKADSRAIIIALGQQLAKRLLHTSRKAEISPFWMSVAVLQKY